MPTATPALTSFARRSSVALSLSLSLTRRLLWSRATLWKPYERALQDAEAAARQPGARSRPAGPCVALGVGRYGKDAGPHCAGSAPAAQRSASGIDPLPHLH